MTWLVQHPPSRLYCSAASIHTSSARGLFSSVIKTRFDVSDDVFSDVCLFVHLSANEITNNLNNYIKK